MSSANAGSILFPDKSGRGPWSQSDRRKRKQFAHDLMKVNATLDFEMSARGWAYYLEGEGEIDKGEIDRAEDLINKLRKKGILPLDATAEDDGRLFQAGGGLEGSGSVDDYIERYLITVLNGYNYDPAFWETQDYYLMVLVEKVDLRSLFQEQCEHYNIPIATSKGWPSINQRGEIIKHCHNATDRGQTPVLLYCGDFDPAGVQISDKLRKLMNDLETAQIPLDNGEYLEDWTAENLKIDRFGLNHDTINEFDLTWINNLKTGSGGDLANPSHSDHNQPYVQNWLDEIGERKVEANAILKNPDQARDLFEQTITKYLGNDPKSEYRNERNKMRQQVQDRLHMMGLHNRMRAFLNIIDDSDD